ncbi:hypothetical protein HJFPF1_10002 [Paramyrothecium foliicola]|nr:hypothetical protein HJFPF1_10002 [Paramyrothecium foliicola]
MTSVATHPMLRSPTVFGLPARGRRQQTLRTESDSEMDDLMLERRQKRALEVEEASVGRACAYIEDFLNKSEWSDQLDSITVHWESIPTMEELESYGTLDATEGTRMCRRFFTAVVVWDDLGHGLWMRLKKTSEQRKAALKGLGPMLRMGVIGNEQSQPQSPAPTESAVSGSILDRRESNESGGSGKSRSSSRSSSSEARSAIPKILRGIIRKQS